jgi:uncharacterized membrane protein YbhN (UPF0104 family)
MTRSTANLSSINTGRNSNVTRWIFGLLIVVFIWVGISHFTQVKELVKTLAGGRWEWILTAALIQVINYVVFTAAYQSAFTTVGVQSRLLDLIPVMLGSRFMNVVAPSGGASGAAVFIDDAIRRGQPPARAAAGLLLQLVSDYIAFTLILAGGLTYLFFQQNLKTYEVVAALVLLLVTLTLSSTLMLGFWRADLLRRLLSWVQRAVNALGVKLHRAPLLSEDWAERNTADFS